MIDSIAATLGVKATTLGAALAGSAVSAIRASHLKPWERVTTFLVGFSSATYLTDPLIRWLNLGAGNYEHGVAFVLGLFGMTIVEAVMAVDWKEIVTRIINKIPGVK